jgi:pilus assembly protein CpaF
MRDLVKNSLRMRPDRIIVGECRGGEALDMLQAMNTGHDGSLTTVHANNPREAISRLETLVMMAGMELPQQAIREQISSAVDLVVQQSRLRDGSRKVISIAEIQGMEQDTVLLSEIFTFEQEGMIDEKIVGKLKPTGVRPLFFSRFKEEGIELPKDLFVESG